MKHFAIFSVYLGLFYYSCQSAENDEDTKLEASQNIVIQLDSINFSQTEFELPETNLKKWYYPYQMLFFFNIFNSSEEDTLQLNANKHFYNRNVKSQQLLKVRYGKKVYNIGSNTRKTLFPKQRCFFIGYNIDLPIFDKFYNKDEFVLFLKQFKNNGDLFLLLNTGKSLEDTISISFSNTFRYNIMKVKNTRLRSTDIGFPAAFIPDSLDVPNPIPGIEY